MKLPGLFSKLVLVLTKFPHYNEPKCYYLVEKVKNSIYLLIY